MGAVWSALLVGGGLAGALFVWLLRGEPGDAEPEKDAPPGAAAAPGGDQGGGGGLSPGPSGQEPVTKPEHLQESNGRLISETKDLGNPQEEAWKLKNPSGEVCGKSREHVPSGQFPDTKRQATSENGNSRNYSESLRNESLQSPTEEWGFRQGREASANAAKCFADKLPSSNLLMDREREVSLAQLDGQGLANHEDWEVVSRHSSWGHGGVGGSVEASALSPNQGMDYGRGTVVEARGWEARGKAERVAAVSSETRQVSVRFQVHYVTSTDGQFLAVTGDHESLGRWSTYIPLHYNRDGFWSHSVFLPADTVVEWKFVLVENGKVTRWEECSNRFLETGHEDKMVHKWWGLH
ncbi:PREDICTED: starch-binding domain-containing protein 1 [Propithecus coquereli]|uniref:Starch-binding domain-containing protein 1 n=1 Tax=Propithecus coquereli TaxID=379532 RepID=A0A2K6FEC3_PROCO|nr:PREDICTED: starch-binding domain-containing protein 1 [Propithecus coquereli]